MSSGKCDICGKIPVKSRSIEHRGKYVTKRSPSTQKPNIRHARITDTDGIIKQMDICARCLRSKRREFAIKNINNN